MNIDFDEYVKKQYVSESVKNAMVKEEYDKLTIQQLASIPMTPKNLYEWAVANGVQDCQMYFPANELMNDAYLTMDCMCKEHRDFDKNKEIVINICR